MSPYRDEVSPKRDGYVSPPRHRKYEDRGRAHSPRPFGRRDRRDRPERPEPSHVLGIFGMSYHTREDDLKVLFGKYGDVLRVQIVRDRYTGDSRGFGFVYFKNIKQATRAKEHFEGKRVDGMKVRVDYSITPDGGPDRHKSHRSRSRSRSRVRMRSRSPAHGRRRSSSRHSRSSSPACSGRRSRSRSSPSPSPARHRSRRSVSRSPVRSRHRSRRSESRSRSS